MTAPFAFIPRKVASTARPRPSSDRVQSDSIVAQTSVTPRAGTQTQLKHSAHSSDEGKRPNGKGGVNFVAAPSKLSDRDCALLVCLALSDHALWSDPNLRRAIDQCNENCEFHEVQSG